MRTKIEDDPPLVTLKQVLKVRSMTLSFEVRKLFEEIFFSRNVYYNGTFTNDKAILYRP